MDAKAEQQKEETGFVNEGSTKAFNKETNDERLPIIPKGQVELRKNNFNR